MFNKSLSCSILALAAAASSYGSFELVMVADYSNNVIRRYDGGTGAALGTFAGGYMGQIGAIAINQTVQRAYVFDRISKNIFAFNYNTGEYIQNWATGGYYYSWLSTDLNGNIILAGSNSGGLSMMARYSPTGTLMTSWTVASDTDYFGAAQSADGTIWALDAFSGPAKIDRFASSGGASINSYSVPGTTTSGGQTTSSGNVVYFPSHYSTTISYFSTAAPASIVDLPLSSVFTSTFGIVFGHGDTAYVAGSKNGNGVLARYNKKSGYVSSIASVATTDFAGVAVAVAPEPGTWLALCGGLALCGLHRRRQ